MPSRRNRSVVTGVAAVIAAALVVGGFALTAQQGSDDPVIAGPSASTAPTAEATSDGVVVIARQGADLPGAAVLQRCDTSSRADVASYDTAALGDVVMQCGNSSQGYEHIRVRHTADWQGVLAGSGSRDWDDAMLTAVQAVLTAPRDGFPKDAGDGKVCYAAALRFDDGSTPSPDGFVKVIVSETTDRVITAYPTRSDDC
ncbi:hypothetical protein EDF24_0932 [Curtobacterium sp. PhB130]|uniref:hypothetical protein n=1 Tax=Curtobacterium sp. PhB130 TaxID=2485178 RepID=UPI000F4C05F8|nr:hypothetical protein [Curtobacterium sp. PhB130]ROS78161.1 hypothetical protein EDF24_0932 [Curtobacterium sp. PhB130]